MSSVGFHEPIEELSDQTRGIHRAFVSQMEEMEAVDWYSQRADACKDLELKPILAHNRDEEKEHASEVKAEGTPAALMPHRGFEGNRPTLHLNQEPL